MQLNSIHMRNRERPPHLRLVSPEEETSERAVDREVRLDFDEAMQTMLDIERTMAEHLGAMTWMSLEYGLPQEVCKDAVRLRHDVSKQLETLRRKLRIEESAWRRLRDS